METSRKAAAALTLLALAVTACGSDSEPVAEPATTTAVIETTAAPSTTAAAEPTTEAVTTTAVTETTIAPSTTAAAEPAGEETEAVLLAYRTVFDSRIPFEDKLPYLEDAAELREVIDEYAASAENFGGISLDPTAVQIDGDVAEVTYNVMFGERAVYTDLTGNAVLVDGAWTVTRERFCTFMSSARVSCPTG